jgi:hypothetical protein
MARLSMVVLVALCSISPLAAANVNAQSATARAAHARVQRQHIPVT